MRRPSRMLVILPSISFALSIVLILLYASIPAERAFAAATANLEIVSVTASQPTALPGNTVSFIITYRNNGPDAVPGAFITDTVPASLASVSFTSSPTVTSSTSAPNYTFQLGTLASGASGTITIQATIATTANINDQITNNATISAPDLTDGTPGNNTGSASITVIEPILTIDKTITTATTAVDAADVLRYQIVVSHTAISTANALALNLTDDMPAALQGTTIVSAIVSDGATSTNVAGSFNINGSGDLVTTGSVNLLLNTNGTNDQVLTIVLQGTVRNTVNPGGTIANAATVTWQNSAPVQKPSYTATDLAPSITIPTAFSVTKSIASPGSTTTVGQIVTYQIETTVIEGTTNNVQWVDTLPVGMSYVPSSLAISDPNGMTINGLNPSLNGQVLTISATSVVNPGNVNNASAADSDSFTLSYQTTINDSSAVSSGTVLTNDVDASANPGLSDNNNAVSVTVIEPVLTVAKTITTSTTNVDAGDTVRYQIRVSHTATSTANALALNVTDDMPAALQNTTIVSAIVSDGATSTNVSGNFSINGSGDLVTTGSVNLQLDTNGANDQVLTVVVQGTVRNAILPGGTIANAATVTWQNSAGVSRASYTATSLAPMITVPQALSLTKSIVTPAGGSVNSGDIVTYQLETSVIEGTTTNLEWVDTLPAGMSYIPDSATISEANGMTIATLGVVPSGQTLTITTSSAMNPGNVNNAAALDTDTFSITYQARVSPTVGHNSVLTNSASVSADNLTSDANNTASITVINIPPTADTLTAPNIVQADAGETSATISMVFTGDVAIDVSSLDLNDLQISGPGAVTLSNMSVTPTGNGTPRTASYTFTPPGGSWNDADNGTYTVSVVASQVFDILGRSVAAGSLGSFTVSIDTTAPTTQIDTNPDSVTNSTSASFTFSGADNITAAGSLSFECKLDTGSFAACSSPASYTNLADGDHTFEVRATDGANNTDASPAAYSWEIDTIAPTATLDQASGQDDPALAAPIRFALTFSEPVTGFDSSDVVISGSANATTSTITGSGASYTIAVSGMTSEGTVTIAISAGAAEDAAGNVNTAPTVVDDTVTFANELPIVTGIVPTGNSPTNLATVSFAISFNRPVSGVDLNDFTLTSPGLNGAALQNVTGSGTNYTLSVSTGTGSGTLSISLVDNDSIVDDLNQKLGGAGVGNGNFAATSGYVIDKLVPTTKLEAFPNAITNIPSLEFMFSGTDNLTSASALSFECKLDAGSFTICTNPQSYTDLANGNHTFSVRAVDAAGNIDASPDIYNWTIDTSAPTATFAAPALSPMETKFYSFTVTYSDNLAIDRGSINANNLEVRTPAGAVLPITLVKVTPNSNSNPIVVTYQVTAPGGTWDAADNGVYSVSLLANTVRDTARNPIPAKALGSFSINRTETGYKIFLPLVGK